MHLFCTAAGSLLCPLLSGLPSRLFFRCTALLSRDDFYLPWGGATVMGAPPFALSFSFLLLCLWVGPNELEKQKSNESENLSSE